MDTIKAFTEIINRKEKGERNSVLMKEYSLSYDELREILDNACIYKGDKNNEYKYE